MKWPVRCVYTTGNIPIKIVRKCSNDVKIKLFNSYCTNSYCCTLWTKFTAVFKRKMVTAYKQVFRSCLKCKKEGTNITSGVHTKYNKKGTTLQMINGDIELYHKMDICCRQRIFLSGNLFVKSNVDSFEQTTHFHSCILWVCLGNENNEFPQWKYTPS